MINFACKRFDLEEIVKCSLGLTKADYSIIMYLIKHDIDQKTTQEISEKLELDLSTVQRSIKKLFTKKLVKRLQKNLEKGGYIFLYQIQNKQEIRNQIKQIIQNWSNNVEKEIDNW
jgi:predicted transcriptional regulator